MKKNWMLLLLVVFLTPVLAGAAPAATLKKAACYYSSTNVQAYAKFINQPAFATNETNIESLLPGHPDHGSTQKNSASGREYLVFGLAYLVFSSLTENIHPSRLCRQYLFCIYPTHHFW